MDDRQRNLVLLPVDGLRQVNPFFRFGYWWFTDKDGVRHGPYKTELEALRRLLRKSVLKLS